MNTHLMEVSKTTEMVFNVNSKLELTNACDCTTPKNFCVFFIVRDCVHVTNIWYLSQVSMEIQQISQ